MSGIQIPHQFEAGKDGIERCVTCGSTRGKKGKVYPQTAACHSTAVDPLDRMTPLDAALYDITNPHGPDMLSTRLQQGRVSQVDERTHS